MRNRIARNALISIALLSPFLKGNAQIDSATPPAATAPTPVPALVPYSGLALGGDGKPLIGQSQLTFLIYKEESGGEPLWMETQPVSFDTDGRYKVNLGATYTAGLPPDLFSSGEARWLEVQIVGEKPQPRVLLVSVPYALKAADSATLGGLPASAFALAGSNAAAHSTAQAITPDAPTAVTTTGGIANKVARFSGSNTIVNSILFDNGTTLTVDGAMAVSGSSTYNGSLGLAATGTATSAKSYNSQAMQAYASAYNSSMKSAVQPHFQWQVEATGNNTASPGGTLNLLASPSSNGATETGLYFNTNGTIHFAAGQTFPATSTSGTGLLGASSSGTGVEGTSTSGDGVQGISQGTSLNTGGVVGVAGAGNASGYGGIAGVWGNAKAHVGVLGTSDQYAGVQGISNSGQGVQGRSTTGTGVQGSSSSSYGVEGTSTSAPGMLGYTVGGTSNTAGVVGQAGTTSGFSGIAGVWGDSSAHVGVWGSSTQYAGVFGQSASGAGVQGNSTSSHGVYGQTGDTNSNDDVAGVYGYSSTGLPGVEGKSATGAGGYFESATSGSSDLEAGVYTLSGDAYFGNATLSGEGIDSVAGSVQGGYAYAGDGGHFTGGDASGSVVAQGGNGASFYGGDANFKYEGGNGIYAEGGTGSDSTGSTQSPAGYFNGAVDVQGLLYADSKDFKIDHPLDPANKYLIHASVESSEMMNIYTGNVTTDESGLATVILPNWFQTLNTDFRYQLTVIGGRFAQAIVSKEIAGNQFTISTNASGVKVSWQVTAVRQDAFAKAHPLVVEETKSARERGFYRHPELYGQPAEKQIEWGRHPMQMARAAKMRAAQKKAATSRSAPTLTSTRPSPGLPSTDRR